MKLEHVMKELGKMKHLEKMGLEHPDMPWT